MVFNKCYLSGMRVFMLSALLPFLAQAQDVSVDVQGELITVGGRPYAMIKSSDQQGAAATEFSIENLDGQELIHLRQRSYQRAWKPGERPQSGAESQSETTSDYYFDVVFVPSGQRCQVDGLTPWPKAIATHVATNDLITGNQLNEPKVERYRLINDKQFSDHVAARSERKPVISINVPGKSDRISTPPDTLRSPYDDIVPRRRTSQVDVFAGNIRQDLKHIGTYSSRKSKGGLDYSFFLANGTKVASARVEGKRTKMCTLLTFKDNRIQVFELRARSTQGMAEDIAKVLVRDYYL